eukprot:6212880-Pleurochrysis_carterae.AAC.3
MAVLLFFRLAQVQIARTKGNKPYLANRCARTLRAARTLLSTYLYTYIPTLPARLARPFTVRANVLAYAAASLLAPPGSLLTGWPACGAPCLRLTARELPSYLPAYVCTSTRVLCVCQRVHVRTCLVTCQST